ncbi:kinase-like protein [Parathielavia appendiculata]|uniref:non-specific serine/threonine protein kinase n=1 Tax=Parathielavia appendiculata TaxID=2587402 RepID=A0AAN6Z954_9PEZI|nr:kinase-like protein [Parathielavia appendiculata]
MSSRAALASPVPVPVASPAASPDLHSTNGDRRRNMPAAVPPRTSSSRRVQPNERPTDSPRRTHADSNRDANGRIDQSDHSSRSRRANQPSQDQQLANGSRDARGNPSTTAPVRSPPPNSNSISGPSREASEILNSILVSQPEIDIDRERERQAMSQPHQAAALQDDEAAPPPVVAMSDAAEEARRGGRSRHDHSRREKQTKFGEYILGNTIGEGEFGKVKLGWKQEGGVQVAIKLIKKDQLGGNPSRMAKIMREVAILKQLTHPNIVKLHKMEESERHYGIVLEYASGGELFDYILNHRYLKDNAARRLFAQLVSGVGYLHKKGIVHRDLKLENLLLDRHKNIIITDFGFANTFDPNDELSEEEELNLTDREFVKRMGLDKVKPNGSRKGDLMQTSCGSPCYAAPELVVSDSLYTGRKVDVWSCGVILYAMLAGYLPFDDDPANPEGDNINLLYKYIVNTPLTFPEYVTPHARDLLRRILVPNPRKRADLFEVARHSWLSEYAHVVEFITSSTTSPKDIQNTTVPPEDEENPTLMRSASVRESSKKTAVSPPIGGLVSKQGTIDTDAEAAAYAKQQRENKRRTVQVEYVAPNTTTQRGEPSGTQSSSRMRARSGSQGAAEAPETGVSSSPKHQPLPRDPSAASDAYGNTPVASRRPPSSHHNQGLSAAAVRGGREATFSTVPSSSAVRPPTGGSMQSTASSRPPAGGNRGSYSQPVPPELADTNAHGRIQQPPRAGSSYGIPASASQPQSQEYGGRPSMSVPPKFARLSGFAHETPGAGTSGAHGGEVKGHKRSSTMGSLFGRSGSLFGGRSRKRAEQQPAGDKSKKYPPVSMNNNPLSGADEARPSMDSKRSRRSFSIGIGKKASGSIAGSQKSQEKQGRRFSFIPAPFSLKAIGIGKDEPSPQLDSQQDLPIQEPPTVDQYGRYVSQDAGREQQVEREVDASTLDGMYAQLHEPPTSTDPYGRHHHQYSSNGYGHPSASQGYMPSAMLSGSDASVDNSNMRRPPGSAPQLVQQAPTATQDAAGYDGRRVASGANANNRPAPARTGVLQKNKRFVDAWDTDSYSRGHDHSGSSGPARKVMDFFRRRGKARGGETG